MHSKLSFPGFCSRIARHLALFALGGSAPFLTACADDDRSTGESQTSGAATACTETKIHPDSPRDTYYTRQSWDPVSRILTAEGSISPSFTSVDTLKWRYGSHRRIIAYIGVEQPFQHDYVYDEHDNVTEFRLSYPANPDLLKPSTADTWIGDRYANEYDATGRLTGSNLSHFGGSPTAPSRYALVEDDAGRCQRVEQTFSSGESNVETILYDEAGRVKHVELAGQGVLLGHTDFTYDDQGRVQTRVYAQDARVGLITRGTTSTTYDYHADGSQTITVHDTITDIASDEHIVVERSAACQAIDDDIGIPDQRCRVPLSF